MNNSFVTIALPIAGAFADAAEAALDTELGNPPQAWAKAALDATGLVHFMSISIIRDTPPKGAHMLFEISVDGGPVPALAAIIHALGAPLQKVIAAAGVQTGGRPLVDHLIAHNLRLGPGWTATPGVAFTGSPGLSVKRIRQEAILADAAADMRDVLEAPVPAADKLRSVRERLWLADHKWAFVAEPAPFLIPGKERTLPRVLLVFTTALLKLSWPLLAVPLLLWPLIGLKWAIGASLVAYLAALGAAAFWLRRLETADVPDDSSPDAAKLANILRHENTGAQNLLAAESRMKPGWFRRLTLRFAFGAITQATGIIFRPGFLRQIGVIHYARWALIPGTDRLLFWSNFSDSWEAYLEDFIEKATSGLTSVWSNTQGFPRTQFLLGGGAEDGDRFRRWARRQQFRVPFWYSGYPALKMNRIRRNAAIRQGIASARTDADAEDWVSLFGSEPRPPYSLEKTEMPTFVFGALSRRRFSACLVLKLPADEDAARKWLAGIAPELTFGETLATGPAAVLGLAPRDMASFPAAFQHGMALPARAQALGDTGSHAPEHWLWGQAGTADAFLMLLDGDAARLEATVARHEAAVAAAGGAASYRRALKPLPEKGGQVFEPFGFADGVSQPILRDTPRARDIGNGQHVIEAGEIVLGYADNRGYIPPTPTAAPEHDPTAMLPSLAAANPGVRGSFMAGGSLGERDLGRNGTFLVVRQLDQDVERFNGYLGEQAKRLLASGNCPWSFSHLPDRAKPKALADLLAAKMVGRWKDGASLVRHPRTNPNPKSRYPREPDNEFLFDREDPQGLRCPFGSHIRRANPRDSQDTESPDQLALSNRHRIIRVGRQYEAEGEGSKPGLMFMCLNADIERQYEFVQRNWILSPSFHNLLDETDPTMGHGSGSYTIPTREGPIRLTGIPEFVTVRGGGYFFLPSRRALLWLAADRARRPAAEQPVAIAGE